MKKILLMEEDQNSFHFLNHEKGNQEFKNIIKGHPSVALTKKHFIYKESESPKYLYYLKKGKLKSFKTHDDGKSYVTDIYTGGSFFGFKPLLENKCYSDSAVLLEDSEVYKIPKEEFLQLIMNNRFISNYFINMLSKEVENKEQQLLSFAYDTVRKRTANALVNLEYKFQKECGSPTSINISREDLASMIGTASETLIRCLSEFKQDRIIEVKGRDIVVQNIKALKAVKC